MYYNGVFNKTQEFGRKENNPLPSKEDNWIIRDFYGTTEAIKVKFGMRTPSIKKSIKVRTTGKAKRAVKKALIPGYGRKGIG